MRISKIKDLTTSNNPSYGPYEKYELKTESPVIDKHGKYSKAGTLQRPALRCLEPIGEMRPKYRLDTRPQQARLLNEYSVLEEDAKMIAWIEANGSPGFDIENQTSEVRLDTLLEGAKSLRDLLDLNQLLQDNPVALVDYVQAEPYLFDRNQVLLNFKNTQKAFYIQDGGLLEQLLLDPAGIDGTGKQKQGKSIDKKYWLGHKKECSEALAWVLLVNAANVMLKNIQPHLQVERNATTKEYFIIQDFAIYCPWQAMAQEFHRRITGSAAQYDYCPRPNCGRQIINKRGDARHCGKSACEKWVQRNLPRIRQYKSKN